MGMAKAKKFSMHKLITLTQAYDWYGNNDEHGKQAQIYQNMAMEEMITQWNDASFVPHFKGLMRKRGLTCDACHEIHTLLLGLGFSSS